MTRYVLGIDGGATTTRAVILDAKGTLYGAGRGGPSYADAGGVAVARTGVGEAVTAALQAAGLESSSLGSAFLGLAVGSGVVATFVLNLSHTVGQLLRRRRGELQPHGPSADKNEE